MHQFIFYSSYLLFLIAGLSVYILFKDKKRSSRLISLVLLLVSLFFIYARFIEPRILVVSREEVVSSIETPAGVSDVKIKVVVFSDLHYGVYKNTISLGRIVEKVNSENPDIVLVPGDFVYHMDKQKIESEFAELKNIKAPVYAVTGNHDEGNFDEEDVSGKVEVALKKAEVNVIDNKIERIKIKDVEIVLVGLEDYWSLNVDYDSLKNFEQNENVIVLTHNPDSVYEFPANANVDLVVCGHTHGGQIRLPIFYKYAIPTKYDFDRGLHNINNMQVYVSSGIGMVGLPMRFLVPPEIVVLEIF